MKRFTIYDDEVKSVLQLIKKLGDLLNEVIENYGKKTDLYGDHKGSWQGLNRPTLSEEGMRGTVEKHITDITNLQEYDKNIVLIKDNFDNISNGQNIKIIGTHNLLNKGTILTGNPFSNNGKVSILLENLEDVVIDFTNDSKLIIDLSTLENPSAITLKNCKNVIIKNLYVEGINHEKRTEHQLTQGNGVYLIDCENCKVIDSRFKNTPGGVYLLNSKDCLIDNCLHEIRLEMQGYQPNKLSTGSYIIIQCENCIVQNSISYGGTGDGNIFLGGGSGQHNCKVLNCNVFNFTRGDATKKINFPLAQGICIDGANTDCVVEGNYVYGFAYGIDLKNYGHSNIIESNTLVKNEMGIAIRPGDQGLNGPDIFGTRIINNTIHPNGGSGMASSYPTYTSLEKVNNPVGIVLHETQDVLLMGNTIENTPNFTQDFYPLIIFNEKIYQGDKNQQGINIIGNMFNNNSSKFTYYGRTDKPAILMRGTSQLGTVLITSNHFTPKFDGINANNNNIIQIDFKCDMLKISNNTFGRNMSLKSLIDVSNVDRLSITDNDISFNSGFLTARGIKFINVKNNNIGAQTWTNTNKLIDISSDNFVDIIGNTYNGGLTGVESSFLTSRGENTKIVVTNNILYLRTVSVANSLTIETINKIVKGNYGNVNGNTLIELE